MIEQNNGDMLMLFLQAFTKFGKGKIRDVSDFNIIDAIKYFQKTKSAEEIYKILMELIKSFLKKFDKNLINQTMQYFVNQNQDQYVLDFFNYLKRTEQFDYLDTNKLVQFSLKNGKQNLTQELLLELPLQNMFNADKIWLNFIETMINQDQSDFVLETIIRSIKFGTDEGVNKSFYEEQYSALLSSIMSKKKQQYLLGKILESIHQMKFKLPSQKLREVLVRMIVNKEKFSEIKKRIIQFSHQIDDDTFVVILKKYTQLKNSNVVYQLIQMCISIFDNKFNLTSLPLNSFDLNDIIILLYCQTQSIDKELQNENDQTIEILSEDMESLLETLSMAGSETSSFMNLE